jgi:hypothetical protein
VAFYNSSVESLRRIEDVFESAAVRRKLDLPRVPKSTLADAQRLFDPELLKPLIEHLKTQVPTLAHNPKLDAIVKDLIAVDGTYFAVAARIAWALFNKPNAAVKSDPAKSDPVKNDAAPNAADAASDKSSDAGDKSNAPGDKSNAPDGKPAADAKPQNGFIRIDFHFDILRGVPEQAVVSGGRLAEQDSLVQHLRAGVLYVIDRALQGYQHMSEIVAIGSDFVTRLREGSAVFDIVEERPLTPIDLRAGVTRDVRITIPSARGEPLDGTPLRMVEYVYTDREGQTHPARLLTNRLDLSAELIVLIYQHRWQIELFFRWLKCMVGWKHFFSESENGITLQTYVALIATLLLAIEVGHQPNTYVFAMMNHVVSGFIPLDEAKVILARRMRERQRAKERQQEKAAQRRAQKNHA